MWKPATQPFLLKGPQAKEEGTLSTSDIPVSEALRTGVTRASAPRWAQLYTLLSVWVF